MAKTAYTVVKSSPILHSETRVGKKKFWQGHIGQADDNWFTQTSYWQETADGGTSIVQWSEPYEATPKNVGKANETSAETQARSEFDSMVKKQRDKGYAEAGAVSDILPLPMLAQKFKDRKKKLMWPVMCQPKYDGNRMLQRDGKCWSRGGKSMVDEVVDHLVFNTNGEIIDGELILPGNVPLEDTAQALKAYKPGISEQLSYIVYDIISPDVYSKRLETLKSVLENAPVQVVLAPTYMAKNEAEVMFLHQKFVNQGYEGTIIRDNSGGYEVGHRSNQLQKYKDFVDAEFEIVGVKEGSGKEKGQAIFECVNKHGTSFDCRPEGSREHREEMWKNRKSLIGKYLTIRYQTLTKKEKVPLYPVGVTVRERGDF